MKAFVIKNKEGLYKKPHLDIREFYTGNLTEAEIWTEKKDAEYFCPKDCEVVEITIEEVDNSKREYNETIKYIETTEPDKVAEYIDTLEQRLAEKDKEINKLQQMAVIDMQAKEILELQVATIRKQVCDEIFKELQENTDCYFEERKCNSPHSQLPYIWFNEIRFRKFLDQIEQGE